MFFKYFLIDNSSLDSFLKKTVFYKRFSLLNIRSIWDPVF